MRIKYIAIKSNIKELHNHMVFLHNKIVMRSFSVTVKVLRIYSSLTLLYGQLCFSSFSETLYQDQIYTRKRSPAVEIEITEVLPVQLDDSSDLPKELWQIIASCLVYPQTKLHHVNHSFFKLVTNYPPERMFDLGIKFSSSLPCASTATVQGITLIGNDWKKLTTIPSYVWYSFITTVFDPPKDVWPYMKKTAIRTFHFHSNEDNDCEVTNDVLKIMGPMLAQTQITTVGLYQQPFDQDGLISFFQALADGPIRQIHISSSELSHLTEHQRTDLGNSVTAAGITDLDFSDNKLGDTGVKTYVEALQKSSLRELDLSMTNLTVVSGETIGFGISKSLITQLRLSNNRLGATGVLNLLTHLKTSQIRCLDISSNQINTISKTVGTALGQALSYTQIEDIDISDNDLGSMGIIALCQELSRGHVLWFHSRSNAMRSLTLVNGQTLGQALASSLITSLDLSDNSFGVSGTLALLTELEKGSIRSLNLSMNQLHHPSDTPILIHFSQALARSCIQEIDLSQNLLTTAGVMALLEGLKGSSLSHLNLSSNHVGPDQTIHFTAIGEALKATSLKTVDLSENAINISGVTDILTKLDGSCLHHLDVSSNKLKPFTTDQIMDLCEAIKIACLKSLDLSYNAFDDQAIEMFVESLATTVSGQIILNGSNIIKRVKHALRLRTSQSHFEF